MNRLVTTVLLVFSTSILLAQVPLAYYNLDDNVTDLSGNGFNGTLGDGIDVNLNPAGTEDRFGVFPHALSYDGVDDFAFIPHNAAFNFGASGDFSIAAWIKVDPNTSDYFILDKLVFGPKTGFETYVATTGQVVFSLWNADASLSLFSTNTYDDSQWHHVVFVADRDSQLRLYVDGVLEDVNPIATNTLDINNSEVMFVGDFFSGKIDQLYIYDAAVDQTIVDGLYADGGWPMIARYDLDGDADNDLNTSGVLDGTAVNATLTSDRFGNVNSAFNFNGTNAYLTVPAGDYFDGDNKATISAWVNLNNNTALQDILYFGNFRLYHDNTGSIAADISLTGGLRQLVPSIALQIGEWTHVVVTYDGAATAMYLNGSSVATGVGSGTFTFDGAAKFFGSQSTSLNFMNGSLDDVQIFRKGFTSTEVSDLYNAQAPAPPAPELSYSITSDISNATYSNNSFSVLTQVEQAEGVVFSNDGLKMFIAGITDAGANGWVFEYDLSTPFDISGATYSGNTLSTNSQDPLPTGLTFSNDGSKLFIIGFTNRIVYAYDLGTPFSLSTAVYNSESFSVFSQETGVRDVRFSNDGSRMFVIGDATDAVYQYDLSTPYDVSTAVYNAVSLSVSAQELVPEGIDFSPDGQKLFMVGGGGSGNGAIYQYDMSTPFNIGTAVYSNISYDVSTQDPTPKGIDFSADGTKMYFVGINEIVYQYDFSSYAFTESGLDDGSVDGVLITSIVGDTFVNPGLTLTSPTHFVISNLPAGLNPVMDVGTDGLTANLSLSGNATSNFDSDDIIDLQFVFTDAAFTSSNAADVINATGPASSNLGIDFMGAAAVSPELTYSISPDLGDAIYSGISFNVGSQDANARGLTFNSDGTQMFIIGTTDDFVYAYNLTIAFDISTAAFASSFSVNAQEINPTDLIFRPDGLQMYVLGGNGANVYAYDLSTSFDITTSVFVNSFSVAAQDVGPLGLTFKPDGSRMFITGNADAVFAYDLGIPFDITSAVLANSLNIISEDNSPVGLTFNKNGERLFVVGTQNDAVYAYNLGIPYDVTTAVFSNSINIGAQDLSPTGLTFNNTGTNLYVLGENGDAIFQYDFPSNAFREPNLNDGSVQGSLITSISGDTFVNPGLTLTSPTHFTIDNLPGGLTPVMDVSTDGLTATLTLSGNATANNDVDDITNLQFTFTDAAFIASTAAQVTNAIGPANSDLGINFIEAVTELNIDFEGNNPVWTPFGGNIVNEILNPDQSGINTSATVLEVIHGEEVFGGQFFDLEGPLDFSTNNIFKIKVWAPSTGFDFRFKVENSIDINDFHEYDQLIPTSNQWVELEFDMTNDNLGNPAASGVYDRIVLFPGWNVASAGTFYIDDIVLGSSGAGGNLIAHYPLVNTTNDESGNAYTANFVGSPAFVDGVLVLGDNDLDGLDIPSETINGLGDFTIATYGKINTLHSGGNFGQNSLFGGANATVTNNLAFAYFTDEASWKIGIDDFFANFAMDTRMDDLGWHHIAVSRQGDQVSLYLDGTLINTVTVNSNLLAIDAGGFIVGQELDAVGGGFDQNQSWAGSVSNFRIYDYPLTQTEVQTLSDNDSPVAIPAEPTNLIARVFSPTAVELRWTDNASNETGYRVEWESSGSPVGNLDLGADATSAIITGLTTDVLYDFEVFAQNATSNSFSAFVSATPVNIGDPFVSVTPFPFTLDEPGGITLTVDISTLYPPGELSSANSIYIHSGLILPGNENGPWDVVTGNWGADDGLGLMTDNLDGTYSISIPDLRTYYGVDANYQASQIGMVFRNEDGTLVGKGPFNESTQSGDIYVSVFDPGLVNPPDNNFLNITDLGILGLYDTDAGNPAIYDFTGPFTIETWVKGPASNEFAQSTFFLSRRDVDINGIDAWGLSVEGGFWNFEMYDQTNANYTFVQSAGPLDPDVWTHVAGVYDGSQLLLYVNGILQGTAAFTGTPYQPLTDPYIHVGEGDLIVSVNDLRFWNVAQADSDIKNNISINLNGTEGGLVGYWPMDVIDNDGLNDYTPDIASVNDLLVFGVVETSVSPDLRISPSSTATSDKSVYTPGEQITVNYRFENTGDGDADVIDQIQTWYILSEDDVIDGNDIVMATFDEGTFLAAGDGIDRSVFFNLPAGQPDGNYRVIIFADGNGVVNESDEFNNDNTDIAITISADQSPPTVSLNGVPGSSPIDNINITITADDDAGPPEVRYYVRPALASGTGRESIATYISGTQYSGQIQASDFDNQGVSIYAIATDASGKSASTDTVTIVTEPSTPPTVTGLPQGTSVQDYDIIGWPFQNAPVSSVLSGLGERTEETWRLFSYNSSQDRYIDNVSNLVPGVGYWLINNSGVSSISLDNVSVLPVDESRPFTLTLSQGIHLIGNPYQFRLDWDAVLAHNEPLGVRDGDVSTLVIYNNGYGQTSSLARFKGAFVKVNTGSVSLEIPFSALSGSGREGDDFAQPRQSIYNNGGWEVMMDMQADNGWRYGVSGFGEYEKAEEGMDNFDMTGLPHFDEYLAATFLDDGLQNITKSITNVKENNVWTFEVQSHEKRSTGMTITFNGTPGLEGDQRIVLFDMQTGKMEEIRNRMVYSFSYSPGYTFKVIKGTDEFIEDQARVSSVIVNSIYPNPNRGELNIPMLLPQTEDNLYGLEVSLKDLSGRVVHRMVPLSLNGGNHILKFDIGEKVKTNGIYLLSITINQAGREPITHFEKVFIVD